jgi:hypothetical protein
MASHCKYGIFDSTSKIAQGPVLLERSAPSLPEPIPHHQHAALEEIILVDRQALVRHGPEPGGRHIALKADVAFGNQIALPGEEVHGLAALAFFAPQAVAVFIGGDEAGLVGTAGEFALEAFNKAHIP